MNYIKNPQTVVSIYGPGSWKDMGWKTVRVFNGKKYRFAEGYYGHIKHVPGKYPHSADEVTAAKKGKLRAAATVAKYKAKGYLARTVVQTGYSLKNKYYGVYICKK